MKIYNIRAGHGEYSAYEERSVCAVRSKEKADEMVKRLNELAAFNNEFQRDLNQRFEWNTLAEGQAPYPIRPTPTGEFIKLSEANITGTISSEDKAQLENIKRAHAANLEIYYTKCAEWQKENDLIKDQIFQKRLDWFAANYQPEAHLKEYLSYIEYDGNYFNDEKFSFEETELLDE